MITIFLKNNLKINIENRTTELIHTIGRNKENGKGYRKEYSNK